MTRESCAYLSDWWEHPIEMQINDALKSANAPTKQISVFTKFAWREMWLLAEKEHRLSQKSDACALLYYSPDQGKVIITGTGEMNGIPAHSAFHNAEKQSSGREQHSTLLGILLIGNNLSATERITLQECAHVKPWVTIIEVDKESVYNSLQAEAKVRILSML